MLLTFVVLAAILYFLLDSRKNYNQQQQLQRISERYELAYKTIYSQHRRLAATIQTGFMSRFKIVDLYQRLVIADEKEKDSIRKELLARVMSRYILFQDTAQLRQLHFHLRNNESFLRMHRPEKFGDNLTGFRDTVAYVNREHLPIDGFEEGKIYNGYRFVFPITASDKTHLGSVEMSFGPEAFTSAMMEQHAVLCNFLISQPVAEEMVFPDELKNNYKQSPFKNYLFDNRVLAELKKVSRKELKELEPCKIATAAMTDNVGKRQAMSVYDSCINIVFTTIPVFHPLTEELIAVFVIRSKSDSFINEAGQFKTVFFMGMLLLGMTLTTFYLQYSKRKTVEMTMILLQQERDLFLQGSVMTFTWQNSENWPVEQISGNVQTLLGYSAEEFLDGSVEYVSLIHADDLQRVMDEVRTLATESNSFTHEPYRLITRTGEIVWVLDNTTVIKDKENKITHFQGYLVDITTTVQLEEEKKTIELNLQRNKKMEVIGFMAGGVAHDLNNILTGIVGYPELLLLQLPSDSELRETVMAIKESGECAAAVVADLLTVARGVASIRNPTSLNTLVAEYFNSPEGRQIQLLYKQIQFLQLLEEGLPKISCSPIHIKKCIMNLVINGAESIDGAGKITVCTETVVPELQWAEENDMEQRKHVLLSITDTGTGIAKENIAHIFEPFYTKKMMGRSGTGLGLAVVWNCVEDHKGKIFVQSNDKGTCFQIYFPASEDNNSELTRESKPVESVSGNGEYILIVDDEPHLRNIGSQMLQAIGYRVESVSSGELAIEFMRNNSVDLIVLDMQMEPGINGCQTYKKILELHPEQKAIIVSGFSENNDVKATLKLGANGFIKKPYSMDRLGRAVRDALNG